MDSSKLLILGGVALGGFLLYNKSKKDRENSQVFVLQNSQTQPRMLSQLDSEIKPNDKELLTPKEATVYATKTIADVNSLIVKYPPLTMNQFIDNYNKVYNTNLTVGGDATLGFKFYAPKSATNTIQNTGKGLVSAIKDSIYQITEIRESEIKVQNADKVFNDMQRGYSRWKSEFATVYSDLKNYFSTLTKEQAEVIIKYLPKIIVQSLMGDNDPRARANDFYSQEEIIDMIDNNINTDAILGNSLKQFQSNNRQFKVKTAQDDLYKMQVDALRNYL